MPDHAVAARLAVHAEARRRDRSPWLGRRAGGSVSPQLQRSAPQRAAADIPEAPAQVPRIRCGIHEVRHAERWDAAPLSPQAPLVRIRSQVLVGAGDAIEIHHRPLGEIANRARLPGTEDRVVRQQLLERGQFLRKPPSMHGGRCVTGFAHRAKRLRERVRIESQGHAARANRHHGRPPPAGPASGQEAAQEEDGHIAAQRHQQRKGQIAGHPVPMHISFDARIVEHRDQRPHSQIIDAECEHRPQHSQQADGIVAPTPTAADAPHRQHIDAQLRYCRPVAPGRIEKPAGHAPPRHPLRPRPKGRRRHLRRPADRQDAAEDHAVVQEVGENADNGGRERQARHSQPDPAEVTERPVERSGAAGQQRQPAGDQQRDAGVLEPHPRQQERNAGQQPAPAHRIPREQHRRQQGGAQKEAPGGSLHPPDHAAVAVQRRRYREQQDPRQLRQAHRQGQQTDRAGDQHDLQRPDAEQRKL